MNEAKLASMKKIEAQQAKQVEQQNAFLDQRAKALEMEEQRVHQYRHEILASQKSEIRRSIESIVSFAIIALPWWKRSIRNIMNKARELDAAITKETQEQVAIQLAAIEEKLKHKPEHVPTHEAEPIAEMNHNDQT